MQPLFLDPFFQFRHRALAPQQVAFIVVDKHQRWGIEIEIGRDGNGQLLVFPLRQAEEQVALTAQQTESGFIKADDIADDRNQPVGQRQRQDHPGGSHQKAGS
ncbi:hypothetical protein D3C78_1449390 [compost metagenome]